MEQITDDHASSDLDDRHKAALAVTDLVLGVGRADAAREASAAFDGSELTELVRTAAIAEGFSKIAIAWGPPPEMPIIEMPTPTPDGMVA